MLTYSLLPAFTGAPQTVPYVTLDGPSFGVPDPKGQRLLTLRFTEAVFDIGQVAFGALKAPSKRVAACFQVLNIDCADLGV